MKTKVLDTTYCLEVYEDSFINDASYLVESATPFGSISVGEFFNHRVTDTWYNEPDTKTEKFIITEIEHIFWVGKNENTHKTMIILKNVSYDWSK